MGNQTEQNSVEAAGIQIKGLYNGAAPEKMLPLVQQGMCKDELREQHQHALANNASILLMDEAFSALDPLNRSDMQSVLLDIQEEVGKTIVFISHDLDEALRLGDRIAILREGEVVQQGTGQDIVLNPANEYIASFVRGVNRGRVIRSHTLTQPGVRQTAWL